MPMRLEGVAHARETFDGIEGRLRVPGPVLMSESKVLEEAEAGVFESYGGEYVRTGALRASLTEDGAGAVRRLVGNTLEFGTSVWYASYQRTIGGPSGTPRGRTRSGPSKVLKLTEAAGAAVGRRVLSRVMRGA